MEFVGFELAVGDLGSEMGLDEVLCGRVAGRADVTLRGGCEEVFGEVEDVLSADEVESNRDLGVSLRDGDKDCDQEGK